MKRLAVLFAPVLGLAACVSSPPGPPPGGALSTPIQCRVGPDGGAPLAERGIGGTGAPVRAVDRGIGGTGAPATRTADRGIGGTGITGIVIGFASVCVDGLEVALDDHASVDIDGVPGSRDALRVGQLVAIKAGPAEPEPVASAVSVRHEVSGPVEAVLSTDPGLIVVAGQRVRVPGKAAGSLTIQPGAWVAVSGLRGPDGDIIASRLDARAPGRVLVHGPLIVADGEATIGSLSVHSRRDTRAEVGTYVTASGTYVDGTLTVESLAPDLLVNNPPAWFGAGTTRLVLESYGQFTSGSATVAGGYQAGLASGFVPPRDLSGPVVMSLEAQADGSFAVIRASPAPVPIMPAAAPAGTYRVPGTGDSSRSGGAMEGQATVMTAGPSARPAGGEGPGAPDPSGMRSYSRAAPEGMHSAAAGGNIVYSGAGGSTHATAGAPGGAAGMVARTGGIRLLGVGVAGHAAAGMIAPHAFAAHPPSMRFRLH